MEHHLRSDLKEYVDTINKNHRQLLNIFGTLREVVLPDEAAIETRIGEIFSSLGIDLFEVAFSFESARASFLKTISKQPPSGKNQQFKDGVLWADCVKLLKTDDVILVSEDKDFYENRDYSQGLAKNLLAETAGTEHSLKIYPELKDLLKEIRSGVPISDDELADSFFSTFGKSIEDMLTRNQFEIGPRLSVQKTLYATEQPNQLSVEFTIEHEAIDISSDARTEGRMRLRGDGMYNAGAGAFASLRNYGEKLTWKMSDGTEKKSENYVAFMGSIVLGHREVTHTARFKLE